MTSLAVSSLGSMEENSSSISSSQLSFPSSFKMGSSKQRTLETHSEQDSLPSSMIGGGKDRSLETHGEGDELCSEPDDNTEMQLALQVDKEVKPVMHLLGLLKEMEINGEGRAKSKETNEAVASLISELQDEVTMIEHRIQNKHLICDEPTPVDEKCGIENLPPDWIALADPDSGDVYFANEVTGETTWDRPTVQNSKENDDNLNDSREDNYIDKYDENGSEDSDIEDLPPDWIELRCPDSGDIYYANEVTGETSWDRPTMQISQEKNNSLQDSRDGNDTDEDDKNGSDEDDENGSDEDGENGSDEDNENRSDEDDENGSDDSDIEDLPPDWIEITCPDSGDVYFANEVTGETSWDRPKMQISQEKDNNLHDSRDDSYTDEDDTNEDDTNENDDGSTEEDHLPPDWIELTCPDTGDVYFANEVTGETAWDRPTGKPIAKTAQESQEQPESQYDQYDSSNPTNDIEEDDDLQDGWYAVTDPDSGDVYYANEHTGGTSWEKPVSEKATVAGTGQTNQGQSTFQNDQDSNLNGMDNHEEDDDLEDGWFSVTDPASGDTYFVNEVTNETSWDKPLAAKPEQNLQNGIESDAYISHDSNNDNNLPDGWFTVIDESSGDTYYANEYTGETSWEMPSGTDTSEPSIQDPIRQISMNSNIGNTVYEDDSVTGSIQF